ncbi:MAG TPA: hypothetical protein PLG30_05740 [Bacteroidia bacterium]|nr:hypothetical protein [Bacteroidia bacterium]
MFGFNFQDLNDQSTFKSFTSEVFEICEELTPIMSKMDDDATLISRGVILAGDSVWIICE